MVRFFYFSLEIFSFDNKFFFPSNLSACQSLSQSSPYFLFQEKKKLLNLLGCPKHVAFDPHLLLHFKTERKKERTKMETPQKNIQSIKRKRTFLVSRSMGTKPNGRSPPHLIRIFPVLLFPYTSTIFCYHLTYRVTMSEGEREKSRNSE